MYPGCPPHARLTLANLTLVQIMHYGPLPLPWQKPIVFVFGVGRHGLLRRLCLLKSTVEMIGRENRLETVHGATRRVYG